MACMTPGFNAVSPKQSEVVRGSGFGVGIDVDDDDNDNVCFFLVPGSKPRVSCTLDKDPTIEQHPSPTVDHK